RGPCQRHPGPAVLGDEGHHRIRAPPHAPGTPALTPILTAATVLVATGLASTFFLYRFQFPRERRKAGRALCAAMDWGDFIHLVLALLNARGYERGFGGGGTDGEYLLQHRGQDWLLSSRHSRAYAPGTTAIAEFSNHIRKRGLDGGILAIPQRFPRAAHALGRAHRVDLLDSDSMWEEMQPLLSEDQHAAIDRPAHARMYVQLVVAWVLAIALAVATYLSIKPRPEVGAITPATANASMGAAEAATPPPLQPPPPPARPGLNRPQARGGAAGLPPARPHRGRPPPATPPVGRACDRTHP